MTRLVDYKGTKIRGVVAPFHVIGAPELIHIGYECGFGDKNSMGFGMVEVSKRENDLPAEFFGFYNSNQVREGFMQTEDHTTGRVTGTMISYLHVCPRQLWFFQNHIEMEHLRPRCHGATAT